MRKKNIPTLIGLLIILTGTISGVYLIERYKATQLYARTPQGQQTLQEDYLPDAYIVLTNNKKIYPNQDEYKNIKSQKEKVETKKTIAYELTSASEILSFVSSHLTIIFVFSTISLALFIFLGLFII